MLVMIWWKSSLHFNDAAIITVVGNDNGIHFLQMTKYGAVDRIKNTDPSEKKPKNGHLWFYKSICYSDVN